MKKNEYKFTLHDLKILLSRRKKCPNCGSQELIMHTENVYKGRQKSTDKRMNLMHEDVYTSTFVYECQTCKRKYTLQGLRENIELNGSGHIVETDSENSDTFIKTKKVENGSGKSKARIFTNLWCFVSTLILLTIALQDKNFKIIFIFAPFILLMYFAFRFFAK